MKTTKEKIEVMQAYEDGELIESRAKDGCISWGIATSPCWDWYEHNYRIKPKEKKKVKLYKYAYSVNGNWIETSGYFVNDSDFEINSCGVDCHKRLDCTMIEVDED